MFNFALPWFALLLPVPLLVYFFFPIRQAASETTPELYLPQLQRLQHSFAHPTPQRNPWQRQRWIILAVIWLSTVLALMSPQWLDKHVDVKNVGFDLMLAVDLSGSMEADDFVTPDRRRIDRLSAVKSVLIPFIEKRTTDRVGLILFATHAYLQAPLTLDHTAVAKLLEKSMLGMAGRDTAIGDAIGLGVKKLRTRPENSRILILLTDGANNAGSLDPIKAAELAKQYNIRVYTIGVGGGGRMFGRGFDARSLKQIAKMTDGHYFSADNLGALTEIYQHIDQNLLKTEAESKTYYQRTPLYYYPLLLALLGLCVLRILTIFRKEAG